MLGEALLLEQTVSTTPNLGIPSGENWNYDLEKEDT